MVIFAGTTPQIEVPSVQLSAQLTSDGYDPAVTPISTEVTEDQPGGTGGGAGAGAGADPPSESFTKTRNTRKVQPLERCRLLLEKRDQLRREDRGSANSLEDVCCIAQQSSQEQPPCGEVHDSSYQSTAAL